MPTPRRSFLQRCIALCAAGSFALGAAAGHKVNPELKQSSDPMPEKPLSILILGGTNFLGPHLVDAAKARGHRVTLFNRGLTETRKQTPVNADEELVGDRDPDKGDGLKALEGRTFDAVIDTSGYFPRMVKASAELLAPNVKQYVFISTLSVYADNSQPGQDESAPLGTLDDPTSEEMSNESYGPLKVLCEKAVEEALPGRATIIRPGFIVGPGDSTDRFTYWPVRFSRGGEVLVPGKPSDPVQFIDARDLSRFVIHTIENQTVGVFNATGPAKATTAGELIDLCVQAAKDDGKDATPVWIPYEFLMSKGVGIGMLPILLPGEGEAAGFHTRSIDAALNAGMTTRPVADTVRDTLAWWPDELDRRIRVTKDILATAEREGRPKPNMADPEKLRAGLTPEMEQTLIKAWKDSQEN